VLQCFQILWEGLSDRRWSAQQLQLLQQRLDTVRALHILPEALRSETLLNLDLVEAIFPAHSEPRSFVDPDNVGGRLFLQGCRWVYPRGWSLQNQAGIYRAYEENRASLFDKDRGEVFPTAVMDATRRLLHRPPSLDPLSVIFLLPKLIETPEHLCTSWAYVDSMVALASLACAMERHRLVDGAYPDSLSQLIPDVIKAVPTDVIGGRPLHYLARADGSCALYSIGWNQTDDEGLQAWSRHLREVPAVGEGLDASSGYTRLDRGDWVWNQPRAAK